MSRVFCIALVLIALCAGCDSPMNQWGGTQTTFAQNPEQLRKTEPIRPYYESEFTVFFSSYGIPSTMGEKADRALLASVVKASEQWRREHPTRKVLSVSVNETQPYVERAGNLQIGHPYACKVILHLQP